MTGIMTEPGGWGERRLADREARRRRTRWTIVGWAILLPAALTLADAASRGFVPRVGGRPAWVQMAMGAGLVVLIGYALWRAWVEDDEVQWRRSVNGLAAIGAATLVLAVVGDMIVAAGAGYPGLRHHLFVAAAAAGLATFAWQYWRGKKA